MKFHYFKKFETQKTVFNNNVYPMEEYAPEGCSIEEIETLEKKMNVQFPQAYKEYLFFMGKEHRLYWSGVEFSFSLLEELQEQAQAVMNEEGYSLEHPFWVINALGYDQFHFFYFKDGDNPPVYHWLGSDESLYNGYANGITQVNKRFSSFIQEMLPSRLERVLDSLNKWKDALKDS